MAIKFPQENATEKQYYKFKMLYICRKYRKMRLTIEIGNPLEVEQLLHVFKTMNLESIHIVVDKGVNTKAIKEDSMTDLLKSINRPIKKKLDLNLLKKAKNYNGVNRERFNKLVKEINIVEPIELLLSQLSR